AMQRECVSQGGVEDWQWVRNRKDWDQGVPRYGPDRKPCRYIIIHHLSRDPFPRRHRPASGKPHPAVRRAHALPAAHPAVPRGSVHGHADPRRSGRRSGRRWDCGDLPVVSHDGGVCIVSEHSTHAGFGNALCAAPHHRQHLRQLLVAYQRGQGDQKGAAADRCGDGHVDSQLQ
ncbi:unnamed protein product, partial [Closterium sp. Yama58-4]